MESVTLGRTGIIASKNGFGALPIQRIDQDASTALLKKAYQSGINFFDTARFYTDSEEKIGYALSDVRDRIYIASKTMSSTVEEFWEQLYTSLNLLKTSYIDIYQFHNPGICPKPGDGTGLYEAMLEARDKDLIRHIGISNHRLPIAIEAAESGLYETIQFPFSYLATEKEIELVKLCRERNIGFIAMKALAGGLITNSAAAYAFLAQYDNVLPIWGMQKEQELDQFIAYINNPPIIDEACSIIIERDRRVLGEGFCRGCGYCLPCPVDIDIPNAARMSLMIRRAPTSIYLNESWKEKMRKIEECTECNHCSDNCPYGLDTPRLLQANWADYQKYM